MSNRSARCPLCESTDLSLLSCRVRPYFRCRHCDLVHLPREHCLSDADEKAEYDRHHNDPDDPGYRHFLSRSFEQVTQRLRPPAKGLDFGCGPGPALMKMAREQGYTMHAYDKFYAPDAGALAQDYDFITCTEVVEHLADPLPILEQLWSILRPGGVLVIQTKRVLDDARFCQWHYPNDPTHIAFFAEASFRWLAQRWQVSPVFPHNDVVVLQK
ncbi:class I SAM-dependent methyltransferase [Hydrogenovibrio halophilus]|uniref:class I SAM-dependent methyltransferase n=1 Tax=Hydrogenovibrio halophilus TaxID=373391 RepID=UPI000369D81D|nr:class I SAM-dependent methyltransferase [Hydrogenovibrio halophilus]